ncbi:MAG: tetratricopeptide repeat protein [Bacteroidota bacterium]|nr:tetratricopeptide repeat protein [Bacteroidota bacterium]
MKKTLLSILTLFLTVSYANAQFINYKDDSGWNLGLNIGGTWQPSETFSSVSGDVLSKSYAGFSGGFTLGKGIFEEEGKFFSFDFRFRYLKGKNYGWVALSDSFVNPNIMPGSSDSVFAYHNYKMSLNEFNLEGVITLHKLREKTGIILYGFGGIGLNYYNVRRDVLNNSGGIYADGSPYDYSSLDLNSSNQQIATDLRNMSDMDFESEVFSPKLRFMPTLGFGLGYQFTDRFSMGIEHKVTYALDNTISTLPSNRPNDLYYYTALNLRWNLFNGQSSSSASNVQDYSSTSSVVNSSSNNENFSSQPTVISTANRPIVNILNPSYNNMLVHNSVFHMKAKVYYVSSRSQIKVKHNGFFIQNFSFDSNSKLLQSNLLLAPGKNFIEVIATNAAGEDRDAKEIILDVPQVDQVPPLVIINHPFNSPHFSYTNQLVVSAKVLNVSAANQISFFVNGLQHTNFLYNPSNDIFTSSILLDEGQNFIEIKASNSVGNASDSKIISYVKALPPEVIIQTPLVSMQSTTNQLLTVKGKILNINSKNNITITHNGYSVSNFSFDPITKEFTFPAVLILGQNNIKVFAENEVGNDADNRSVTYKIPEQIAPPKVIFEYPKKNPHTTVNSNLTVSAKVLNVNTKNQIDVAFNGSATLNFSFNSATKMVQINVNLIEGENSLKISATNQAGFDVEQMTINFQVPIVVQPPIINYSNPVNKPENTSSNEVEITGTILNVSSSNGAFATLNNQQANGFTFDPATKNFSCHVVLEQGPNEFEVDAFNTVGTASKSTVLIYTPEECIKPTISLLSPAALNSTTENSKGYLEMTISAQDDFIFKIDGQQVPSYNFDASEGKFSSYLQLKPGVNSYELIATNECGSTSKKVNIIYEEILPCENPVINLISPREFQGVKEVDVSLLPLRASIIGITNAEGVAISLNGKKIGAFNFNLSNSELMINLQLEEGENKIVVLATNDCGTSTQELLIELNSPVPPPSVNITQPSNSVYSTTTNSATVLAKVKNVSSKADIHVSLDGQKVPFSFNSSKGMVSSSVNLDLGSNNFIIEVENESGSDLDRVELIRNGTPPKVHFTNRSENTSKQQPEILGINSRISVLGYVSNYDGASFSVTLNGSPINFIYNASNGTFTGMINITSNQLYELKFSSSNQWGQGIKYLYILHQSSTNGGSSGSGSGINNNFGGKTPPSSASGNNGKGAKNFSNSGVSKVQKPLKPSNSSVSNPVSKQTEFQRNINRANQYFNAKKWTSAKSYYQRALRLKPGDSFSKNRINQINQKLARKTAPTIPRPSVKKPVSRPNPGVPERKAANPASGRR